MCNKTLWPGKKILFENIQLPELLSWANIFSEALTLEFEPNWNLHTDSAFLNHFFMTWFHLMAILVRFECLLDIFFPFPFFFSNWETCKKIVFRSYDLRFWVKLEFAHTRTDSLHAFFKAIYSLICIEKMWNFCLRLNSWCCLISDNTLC